MRYFIGAAALAALAVASPVPQDLDWDAIDALDPIASTSIPIVDVAAQATTVTYDAAEATASVIADISADGVTLAVATATATATADLAKRDNSACPTTVVTGSGPSVCNPDTPEAFLSNAAFAAAASSAPTPSGFAQVFKNTNASPNAMGYMGYTTLTSYDTQACANQCNSIDGCMSFNVYYERDPQSQPKTGCTNPPSLTNIKCVFWGGPISASNNVNNGQYQDDFHVVIAGSNGYMSTEIVSPPGYSEPTYLGKAAINALLDCKNQYTYMGVKIWNDGTFNASRCAAACTATSQYDVRYGLPSFAAPQTCQFFNTYLLLKNGTSVGQYCAMYNETWSANTATNVGQYRGYNHYTIDYSYSYSNATNAATAC